MLLTYSFSTSQQVSASTKKLRDLAQQTTNQFALYYYIYIKGKTTLHQLYKTYMEIAGKRVRLATLRKQLKILEERYKAVRKEGEYYIPLLQPELLLQVIDIKRSKAGKRGALKRILNIHRKPEQLQIPRNLAYYVAKVHEEVQKLLRKGDRTAALDLLVHTYLPLRENEVLWLWKGNEFIYWDNKNKTFRCLYSEKLSKLLQRLGYTPGLMVWHILGHERASKVICRLFGKGHLNWPWSRSIAYGLMKLEILKEGNNYRIEALYRENHLYFTLRNYYTGYLINEYTIKWNHEHLPLPLSRNLHYYKGLALGVAHTNSKNDKSYFSRW